MARRAWLTYAWDDNAESDVDYFAQELRGAGVEVGQDRWTLGAGRRLWEQIEREISDPARSDAWIFYVTQASLNSEACREELAFALGRALDTRGGGYPLIGVSPGRFNREGVPAPIATRLAVSLRDPDWRERIVAAVEGRELNIARPMLSPYFLRVAHDASGLPVITVRPRAGTWVPFRVVVPLGEHASVSPVLHIGPWTPGAHRTPPLIMGYGDGPSPDGKWWGATARVEVTPTLPAHLYCNVLPSCIGFGQVGPEPKMYVVPTPKR